MTKSPNSFFNLHGGDDHAPAFGVAHGDGLDPMTWAAAIGVYRVQRLFAGSRRLAEVLAVRMMLKWVENQNNG